MASEATMLQVGDREVRISSPSRVLWPDLGVTKLDLARYLAAVGDAFVRANGGRPMSLQRFPAWARSARRRAGRGCRSS
jgi:DNA primase